MTLPRATQVVSGSAADDSITLGYEARLLRRRRLETAGGLAFLVDLPESRSLDAGDVLLLDDNRRIAIEAAKEPLYAVTGDLTRLAWHLGNRHTPCQIERDRLLIQRDHVLAKMLRHLGATVTEVTEAFTPEGGSYGHGHTMGQDVQEVAGRLGQLDAQRVIVEGAHPEPVGIAFPALVAGRCPFDVV